VPACPEEGFTVRPAFLTSLAVIAVLAAGCRPAPPQDPSADAAASTAAAFAAAAATAASATTVTLVDNTPTGKIAGADVTLMHRIDSAALAAELDAAASTAHANGAKTQVVSALAQEQARQQALAAERAKALARDPTAVEHAERKRDAP